MIELVQANYLALMLGCLVLFIMGFGLWVVGLLMQRQGHRLMSENLEGGGGRFTGPPSVRESE